MKKLTNPDFQTLNDEQFKELYSLIVCGFWELLGEGCSIPWIKKYLASKYNLSIGVVDWVYFDRPDLIEFVKTRKYTKQMSIRNSDRDKHYAALEVQIKENSEKYNKEKP